MWKKVAIQASTIDFSTANASVEVIKVDPWTHGVAEGNGNFSLLSFPNAVAALLSNYTSDKAVFALGIASNNLADFATQINSFCAAFPIPYFQRIARMAGAVSGLKESRMILAPPSSQVTGFKLNALPSIKSLQLADLQKKAADLAAEFIDTNPVANLDSFLSEKTAHTATVDNAREVANAGLTGAEVWQFYAASDVLNEIKKGHPDHDMTYTTIIMFVGHESQLGFLTALFP